MHLLDVSLNIQEFGASYRVIVLEVVVDSLFDHHWCWVTHRYHGVLPSQSKWLEWWKNLVLYRRC